MERLEKILRAISFGMVLGGAVAIYNGSNVEKNKIVLNTIGSLGAISLLTGSGILYGYGIYKDNKDNKLTEPSYNMGKIREDD
ncbi:MAG: hypothetical protein AABX48_03530 [Nanoarchaeota archaeon]